MFDFQLEQIYAFFFEFEQNVTFDLQLEQKRRFLTPLDSVIWTCVLCGLLKEFSLFSKFHSVLFKILNLRVIPNAFQ